MISHQPDRSLHGERAGSHLQDRLGPWELDRIHHADALPALRQLPDDCLDVVVTSPPYWGQREGGGLGVEPDPRDYIRSLVEILAETLRCLKPSGTLWLNLGDSYNTPINWRYEDYKYSRLGPNGNGLGPMNSAYTKPRGRRRAFIDAEAGWLQYGNLLGIPYRVVAGLCDMGYLFRGEVIWYKSRPMPEGRARRPHRHHESIYIIAKDERHYFRTSPPVPSVWRLRQTPNHTRHSSTFPEDLPRQCIDSAGVEGVGIVFDPFMGSGTTAVAAKRAGHRYLGFEISAEACSLAEARLQAGVQTTLLTCTPDQSAFDKVFSEEIGLRGKV